MRATAIVQAAIHAWKEKDTNALAPYLSDDVICKQILPQSIGKAQLLTFMKAITSAFPDWSFDSHILHEESLAEHSWSVLLVTRVTGTHTGDLILPALPIIPATGMKIALPYRHLIFLAPAIQLRRSPPISRPAAWRKSSRSWGWNTHRITPRRNWQTIPHLRRELSLTRRMSACLFLLI